MDSTYDQLPASERARIDALVRSQLAELKSNRDAIMTRAGDSLTYYIARLIHDFARELGYVVALPLAYATRYANDFVDGFGKGWSEIWG